MIRLENVLKISLQDVLKMSWRRFKDVLKISWRRLEDVFARRLEDVFKTSRRRLEDVLKMYGQGEYIVLEQDVLKTSSEDVRVRRTYSSWSRHLEDVLKMSSEDEDERVFKTSSSRRMFAGVRCYHIFNQNKIWATEFWSIFKIGVFSIAVSQ